MRGFFALVAIFQATLAGAQDWEDMRVFSGTPDGPELRIVSSTDTSVFAPFITAYQRANPSVTVEYLVAGTAYLDDVYRAAPEKYDLVISSAMDLQLKLANDGFALPVTDTAHPEWAQWRNSLFGFTAEPAAIVINRAAFADLPSMPGSRQDLINVLRAHPDRFRGKVGTYDVRQSGLGYLFATQDARASETYWRLTEVMGALNAQLYCCSGDMIDDLVRGDLLVAYNVLGSYAAARPEIADHLEIILPSEFPTTMMRTALVSRHSSNPEPAIAFLRHLIAPGATATSSSLPGLAQPNSSEPPPIAMEIALLAYLDTLKRRTFIREWENAIIQKP